MTSRPADGNALVVAYDSGLDGYAPDVWAYTYDTAGNALTSTTDYADDGVIDGVATYTYDVDGNVLTSESVGEYGTTTRQYTWVDRRMTRLEVDRDGVLAWWQEYNGWSPDQARATSTSPTSRSSAPRSCSPSSPCESHLAPSCATWRRASPASRTSGARGVSTARSVSSVERSSRPSRRNSTLPSGRPHWSCTSESPPDHVGG